METILVIGLAGAAAASAATPGPCILMASSRTVTGGLPSGLRVVLGVLAGKSILLGCSWAVILGALSPSESALETLRFGGLVVLVLISLSMFAPRPVHSVAAPSGRGMQLKDTNLGFVLSLSSPLSLMFIFALLPQFVDVQRLDATGVALASGAVLAGGTLPLLTACIVAARVFRAIPRLTAMINRICGATLLCFAGLALAIGS